MNVKSLVAFLIAAAVLGFAIAGTGGFARFLDARALLVVLGGTVAAGAISFSVDRTFMMFRVFIRGVLRRKSVDYTHLVSQLMDFAEAYRVNAPDLASRIDKCQDPFLREAMGMALEGLLDRERLIKVLKERVSTMYDQQCEEVVQFRTIGRYPPAFGLIGTTLSMITLLQKLGQPEGQRLIGPAMAIGLVATFYGLILSNLVFNPISENLAAATRRHRSKNLIIVEGVALILEKTNPLVLAEELNSFLVPTDRVDWRGHALSQREGQSRVVA